MILSGEESGEGYEEEMLRQNAVTLYLGLSSDLVPYLMNIQMV